MSQALAIVFAGLSIGLMIGLSASPVVGAVIPILLGVVTSAIALLAGIKQIKAADAFSIRVWPVSALCIALVLGSLVGIRLRTTMFLGTNPEAAMDHWTKIPFGLPRELVARRLFDFAYPGQPAEKSPQDDGKAKANFKVGSTPDPGAQPWLYSAAANIAVCANLQQTSDGGKIREMLNQETSGYWKQIAKLIKPLADSEIVKTVEGLCQKEPQ